MISGATTRTRKDGSLVYKLKTPRVTFSMTPTDQPEVYSVVITPRDLGGVFKNSAALYEGAKPNSTNSVFGPFRLHRRPGINAVSRPGTCGPLGGNAIMMWPNLTQLEKTRLFDQLEKLIRQEVPKLAVEKRAA